jgi:beta-N-acetylhexosaminidase
MRVRSLALLVGIALGAAATPRPEAGVAGAAARSSEDERIDSLLAGMPLRDKAAQMVMPWIEGGLEPGTAAYRRAERLVREQRVGGFIVGKGSRSATAASLTRLQQRSRIHLLVGADLEWGAGMRLLGGSLLPVAMAVGATGDTALAFAHGRATAVEARASGIDMVFAPVLDVNTDPRNPIINTRSFGADPNAVARLGAAVARGLRAGGVLAVGKHFPGHGATDSDSHVALPVVSATRARLDSVELVPFRAAASAGIDGLMTAHIALPAITGDRVPATLSRTITTGILRDALDYDGLIVTDALNMAAVTRRAETAAVALQAVRAGADILLQPPDAELAIDAIVEGVRRGELSRQRVDASVRRILRAKARARRPAPAPDIHPAALADTIAARSITLLRDSVAHLPLRPGRPVLSLAYSSVAVPGGPNEALDFALRSAGVELTRRTLSTRRATLIADSLIGAWKNAAPPLVIIGSYAHPVAGARTTGLPPRVRAALERIAGAAPTILIVFGDPYVAADVPAAGTVLLAWSGIPASQRAAAGALLGRAPISGRSPVPIGPYPLGAGLDRARE